MRQEERMSSLPTLVESEQDTFRREILEGLLKPKKELPAKYLYDERGSSLFEHICQTKAYYITRTEQQIMQERASEMASLLGPNCLLIEYGSGNCRKVRTLLDVLADPAAYIPLDISKDFLQQAAATLAVEYPALEILPVCADYTRPFELPTPQKKVARTVAYYPGSTIGNFAPKMAVSFLKQMAAVCQGVLIGVDLKKDVALLNNAYNQQGVRAQFRKNLLVRINRELGGNFQIDQFESYAFYNPTESRIEIHLVSAKNQVVRIGNVEIAFKKCESIWLMNSYKYTLEDFASLAAKAELIVDHVWTDAQELFSIQYLKAYKRDD